MKRTKKPEKLLGFAFNQEKGGDKYLTRAEGFEVYGGTKDTHEQMREIAVRFDEKLKKDHKSLQEISHQEMGDRIAEAADKVIK